MQLDDLPMPWLEDVPAKAAPRIIDAEASGKKVEKKPAFGFVQAGAMMADHAPPAFVIDDMIEAGTLGQLFGASGCGKSFMVLDWAACIATGRDWHGKATEPGAVFYIAGEGFAGFKRRLRAWEINTGQSVADAPLFFSTQPAALMDAENALAVRDAVKSLAAEHGKPAMIVVDTLHRNMGPGDENNAGDVAEFIASLDAIRLEFGAAVLVVHHSGHGEATRSRGSSSLRAAMDHEYCLTKLADGSRQLSCTKMKEAEPPPDMNFALQHIDLDWHDGNGGFQSSAVLTPCAPPAEPTATDKAARLTGAAKIAHAAIVALLATADGSEEPPDAIRAEFGDRAPLRVVHEDAWRDRCYLAGISDGTEEAKKKAFQRARKSLIDAGIVSTWAAYYWCFAVIFSAFDAEGKQ